MGKAKNTLNTPNTMKVAIMIFVISCLLACAGLVGIVVSVATTKNQNVSTKLPELQTVDKNQSRTVAPTAHVDENNSGTVTVILRVDENKSGTVVAPQQQTQTA